jgi:glyoxylase-like metal-dependent hydrolase (beta-lactamase superfamily II)
MALKLTDRIYLVGSGDDGLSLTVASDCSVFLIDGGTELALVDAGIGIRSELIVREIESLGFMACNIKKVFLTHGHADHSGGAYFFHDQYHAQVFGLKETSEFVSAGDLEALSIAPAVKAGVFPAGYVYVPCPVAQITEDVPIRIGDLQLHAVRSDGHCCGHACYWFDHEGKRALFAGDSIFHGGKASFQAIWDCNLQEYVSTISKLELLKPDLFLPAHGCISLSRGYVQIEKAMERIKKLRLPENILE